MNRRRMFLGLFAAPLAAIPLFALSRKARAVSVIQIEINDTDVRPAIEKIRAARAASPTYLVKDRALIIAPGLTGLPPSLIADLSGAA